MIWGVHPEFCSLGKNPVHAKCAILRNLLAAEPHVALINLNYNSNWRDGFRTENGSHRLHSLVQLWNLLRSFLILIFFEKTSITATILILRGLSVLFFAPVRVTDSTVRRAAAIRAAWKAHEHPLIHVQVEAIPPRSGDYQA